MTIAKMPTRDFKDVDLKTRDKRDVNLTLRVTETERDAIAEAASRARLPVADFIREATRVAILEQRKRKS